MSAPPTSGGCPAIWPEPSPRPGTPWAPPGTLSSATLCWTGPILRDMFDLARASGPPFLEGYVRINIDVANLKSLVRTLRMGKDVDFLRGSCSPGGNVDVPWIMAAVNAGTPIRELYSASTLTEAAEPGQQRHRRGLSHPFEKLCDDAVMAYIGDARYVAFGGRPPGGPIWPPGRANSPPCASS